MRKQELLALGLIALLGLGIGQPKRWDQPQPPKKGLRFQTIVITGYRYYTIDLDKQSLTLHLEGQNRIEVPDQGLVLQAPEITATIATPEGGEVRLQKAQASGGVYFTFQQKEPKRKLRARAQSAQYEDEHRTLRLQTNVFAESEDEHYLITQEGADQATIVLGEEIVRAHLEGDPSRQKMTIHLKQEGQAGGLPPKQGGEKRSHDPACGKSRQNLSWAASS